MVVHFLAALVIPLPPCVAGEYCLVRSLVEHGFSLAAYRYDAPLCMDPLLDSLSLDSARERPFSVPWPLSWLNTLSPLDFVMSALGPESLQRVLFFLPLLMGPLIRSPSPRLGRSCADPKISTAFFFCPSPFGAGPFTRHVRFVVFSPYAAA